MCVSAYSLAGLTTKSESRQSVLLNFPPPSPIIICTKTKMIMSGPIYLLALFS